MPGVGQGAQAVRVWSEGVDCDDAQGGAGGGCPFDARQPVRRAHVGRSVGAGGDPERRSTGNRDCRPRLKGRCYRRCEGLSPRFEVRHHAWLAGDDPVPQRHRAGHRPHEGRRQARSEQAQRGRWATRFMRCCAVPGHTCG